MIFAIFLYSVIYSHSEILIKWVYTYIFAPSPVTYTLHPKNSPQLLRPTLVPPLLKSNLLHSLSLNWRNAERNTPEAMKRGIQKRRRWKKNEIKGRGSTTTAAECICSPFPSVSTLKACRRNRLRGYPISRRDLTGEIFAAPAACASWNAFTRPCLRVNLVKGFPGIARGRGNRRARQKRKFTNEKP